MTYMTSMTTMTNLTNHSWQNQEYKIERDESKS